MTCFHNILSKILANRLKRVICSIYFVEQTVFVPETSIIHEVLGVNEVLDMARRLQKNCMIMKIEFERAYDCVSWSFLRYLFNRLMFGEKWKSWMEDIVLNGSISMLVNGSASMYFLFIGNGLRQGDFVSPFNIVMVMEGLTNIYKKTVVLQEFRGFHVNEEVSSYILSFVDDVIILCEGSCSNLWSIKVILRGLELILDLRVNFFKSNIYGVNVNNCFLQSTSIFMRCYINKLPFKFMGVQVESSPRRASLWKNVIENVRVRFSSWKGRGMSMGGRMVMINVMLNSILTFMLSF